MPTFPFSPQLEAADCGPACLKMVAAHYGRSMGLTQLRAMCYIDREGVSMLGISEAAEALGLRTMAVKSSIDKLYDDAPLPFIAHWRQRHFVVVYKITNSKLRITNWFNSQSKKSSNQVNHGLGNIKIHVADPAEGLLVFTLEEFLAGWVSDVEQQEQVGVALLLEPSPEFYQQNDTLDARPQGFGFLWQYVRPYYRLVVQLLIGFAVGLALQFVFPFLSQSLVDHGIAHHDVPFIYIILVAQVVLFFSQTMVEFIRSWILLHIGSRINISIISDYLARLMQLPIAYFDSKMTADIMQRIQDHHKIEQFLTGNVLNTLFSMFSLVVFSCVLVLYSWKIFLVFLAGSLLYIAWVSYFLKIRRIINYKMFDRLSENQSKIMQLITGMQEIKLHNAEQHKRWDWERVQAALFKINMKTLRIDQWQQGGSAFINQITNIIITFLTAMLVVEGKLTLGMMMAVQYIIGQMNAPIVQLMHFMRMAQDAKISIERLTEVNEHPLEDANLDSGEEAIPDHKTITFDKVSFQYSGPHSPRVLDGITLTIPVGKTTAIVGTSGSGKTTLLKLILKFYQATEGKISIDTTNLKNISNKAWRRQLGTVMQDGFIFNDTIANNVAVGVERIDKQQLVNAVRLACIEELIEQLPLGFNTKIGSEGMGLSQGQKQRLLIARAMYKNPEIMLFDEATNALDATTEKNVMANINQYFENKTMVVVAHRLSTVKNAHQIIAIEGGKIVEQGNHVSLVALKGKYYELVKNQLELGE